MKLAKIVLWIVTTLLAIVFITQNLEFFKFKQVFNFQLFSKEYVSSAIPFSGIMVICFFSGFLLAYLYRITDKIKSARNVRKLNSEIRTQKDELISIQAEIDSLKTRDLAIVTEPVKPISSDNNTEFASFQSEKNKETVKPAIAEETNEDTDKKESDEKEDDTL